MACGCVAATLLDRLGGEVYGSGCRVQRTWPGTWRHRPGGGDAKDVREWGGGCCAVVVGLDDGFEDDFLGDDGGDADENHDDSDDNHNSDNFGDNNKEHI